MLYSHISDLYLPPEIILKIIEAMDYEPRLFAKLMCISKDFIKLIKANESSISTHIALRLQSCPLYLSPCTLCDSLPKSELLLGYHPLMSSRSTSAPLSLRPRTLPWLQEVYQRSAITNELVSNSFQEVMATIYEVYPELKNDDHCMNRLTARVTRFLRISIQLLFYIFDARHNNEQSGRSAQELAIKSMTCFELAIVNLLLFTTSIYYCYSSASESKRPVEVQREIQSVFRELALRHGPQLIWVSLFGGDVEKLGIAERIEKGLIELGAFENPMGGVESELIVAHSLQSVLMREFCRKTDCDLVSGWNVVVELVKDKVLFPDADKSHVL